MYYKIHHHMLKNIDAYILRRHKVASDFLKSPEQQILYTCIDNSQMCILSTWCHDLRVQYLTINHGSGTHL